MKRTCQYCGRIHEYSLQCPQKPKPRVKRDKDIDIFRGSKQWKSKRTEILRRDKGLCIACRFGVGCEPDLTPATSVHHITPLVQDMSMALDDNNLISLCEYHHEQAECGAIPAEELRGLVEE